MTRLTTATAGAAASLEPLLLLPRRCCSAAAAAPRRRDAAQMSACLSLTPLLLPLPQEEVERAEQAEGEDACGVWG